MTKSRGIRKPRTVYTPEIKQKIIELYLSGVPIITIHKEHGWHQNSIAKILKEAGVDIIYGNRFGIQLTEEQEREIIELYKQGKQATEISYLYGCSRSRVWTILKNHKIETRLAENQERYKEIAKKLDAVTRVCTKCHQEKSLEQFYLGQGYRNGLHRVCIECEKRYPSLSKNASYERLLKARRRNQQFMWDYYASHPCMDCGESDPIVLTADHVRGDKFKEVSYMVHNTFAIKRIEAELAKCDIVCQNCHRRREAKKQGWYTGINTGD